MTSVSSSFASSTPLPVARDFGPLHTAMRRWVDSEFLSGISVALVAPGQPVHVHCAGAANRESGAALREDHLFRVYSNTKLFTSCAVLLLLEEGRFELTDAVGRFLPALARMRVLRPGARTLAESDAAHGPITIAQLLGHTAGLSYGLFDPGTLLYRAYQERRILSSETTLAQMVEHDLPALPLAFEPGSAWEYSVATDVLARLVEVRSGVPFDHFLRERIIEPLVLRDTGFVVPARERERLATMYIGADVKDPAKAGLRNAEQLLPRDSHLLPVPRVSGGGGLVSSLPDTARLLQHLLPGRDALLRPETLALMTQNQLPPGQWLRFPATGEQPGRVHGLAGGVVLAPGAQDHAEAAGELYWGGLAGTQWWISPRHNFAGAFMTQRWWGFDHPLLAELKREAYTAMLGTGGAAPH